MTRRLPVGLQVLLLGAVLVACGGSSVSEPARAFSTAEVEALAFYPTSGGMTYATEWYASVRITNPTADKDLALNAANWGIRLANGEFYFSRTVVTSNESRCTATVVAPGRSATCSLFFGMSQRRFFSDVFPVRLSYSPAGWSSGTTVEGVIETTW